PICRTPPPTCRRAFAWRHRCRAKTRISAGYFCPDNWIARQPGQSLRQARPQWMQDELISYNRLHAASTRRVSEAETMERPGQVKSWCPRLAAFSATWRFGETSCPGAGMLGQDGTKAWCRANSSANFRRLMQHGYPCHDRAVWRTDAPNCGTIRILQVLDRRS